MRSRLRASLTAAATLVASLAVAAPPAVASNPVCADPTPRELCGGRVFAEPLQSVSGLTYDQLVRGLQQLATDHPDWVTFEAFGRPSADHLTLYRVEVTAPFDPTGENGSSIPVEDRKIVLVNQSIHGNEPGGREGAPRFVEDLVTGAAADSAALLDRVRFIQTFINPDGWTAGDHDHVQTDGGLGLWNRTNGDGAAGTVSGPGDAGSILGLGVDLNRQAPWPGPSRRNPAPNVAPEMQSYVEYVHDLKASGDIVASVDIHGEVTDAAALIMLSAGEYDLDESLNQRIQGDAMVDRLFEDLSESDAYLWTQMLGEYPAGELIASSEFLGGGTDTGYVGDWVSMESGGDSASLSTIELYNFVGAPGANSLTARPEVMQLYRDTVAGILASMIEQAAFTHQSSIVGTGTVGWTDGHARVTDPARGVEVTSAAFYEDLTDDVADGLVRLDSPLTAAQLDGLSAVVVGRADTADAAVLEAFAAAGGRVVLTDEAVQLAADLFGEQLSPGFSLDNDAIVSIDGPREGLLEGVRETAFMLIEPVTVGFNRSLAGETANLPVWKVDAASWTAVGGSAAITHSGGVVAGTAPLGDGEVTLIGQLTPDVPTDTQSPVDHGLESYGVLDTGYLVLTNALGGDVVTESVPSVPEAGPVGTLEVAQVGAAPSVPQPGGRAVPAAVVLLLGLGLTARQLRAHDRA